MAISNEPRIVLRYDSEPARHRFEAAFGQDFRIHAVTTDQTAIAALTRDGALPSALVVLPEQPAAHSESPLLALARDQHPGLMKILISNAMPLDLLVSLLEQRLIDRCFEQPVNPDLLRSQILTAALAVRETAPAHSIPAADTGLPAVLIVDDETAATKYLARQLDRLQDEFRILCADNAEQALACIRAEHGAIAVVMTDQRMPGMQGKELLDELKQSHPETVRILTSAYGEVDVALEAVNEGEIFRYQKKPWRASELLPLFQQAIARHRALRSARHSVRSHLEHQFAELRRQRHIRLHQTLSETLGALADGAVAREFLEVLDSIEPLPANASHLRASRETGLERELVQQFGALVQQQLARLGAEPAHASTLSESAIRAGLQAEASADGSADDSPATALLCQALVTLLTASGLDWRALSLDRSDDGVLVLTTTTPLRMYTHLLAPLTGLSRPLLDQQAALLMLFVSAHRLAGRLRIEGGRQSFSLTLQLPLAPATRLR